MSEYTSPEVSKRLAVAGFQNEKKREYDGLRYCYRSDTLLMWLLESGEVRIHKCLKFYRVQWLHWHDEKSGIRHDCDAATLPDALGEVVMKVLAREADNGNS